VLLNGKRPGNLSAIEAIPNSNIIGFYNDQIQRLARRPGRFNGPRGHVAALTATLSWIAGQLARRWRRGGGGIGFRVQNPLTPLTVSMH
jgi:hypothetical protein